MSEQTGLLLVHGSELGGWVWQRLVPLLRHPSLAVDLPGRGAPPEQRRALTLQDHVDHVVTQAQRWTAVDRVVLVAHSASGVLAPAVSEALRPRVAGVVFLAATVPEGGRSWLDLQPLPARWLLRLLHRVRPAGGLSPRGETVRLLCADLEPECTALVLDRRVPEPWALLADTVKTADLCVPAHVVSATGDRALSARAQRRSLARLPATVAEEVPGGHLPMLSAPSALAALLDRIADDVTPVGRTVGPAG